MSHLSGWRYALTFTFILYGMSLLAGCGTFEVRGEFVTPTPTVINLPTKTPPTPDETPTSEVPTLNLTATLEPPLTAESDHLDIPRLDDAQIVVDISTHLIYRSESDLNTAIEFYEQQMRLDGWTQENVTRGETNAQYTFSREDQTVTITITEDWLGLSLEAERAAR